MFQFFRRRRSRHRSTGSTVVSRRPLTIDPLEDRLVLDAQALPGQVLAQITVGSEVADLADYIDEFDWQEMLTGSTIENVEQIFDILDGANHQYVMKFRVDSETDVVALAADLSTLSFLDWAEPNYAWWSEPLAEPNDPFMKVGDPPDYRSFYTNSGLLDAWDETRGAGVIIGSLEGNFDPNIPDLAPNVFVNEDEIPGNDVDDDNNGYVDDYHGVLGPVTNEHGTRAASVATAVYNNAIGIAGVAGEATIIGAGLSLVDAVDYLIDNGARSAYHYGTSADVDIGECGNAAMRAAVQNQLLIVAAVAGNEIDNLELNYGHPGFLKVAGTEVDSSNRFSYGPWVDIAAQAVDVPMARPTGQSPAYTTGNGLSWAMPQISGLAALIWSAHPEWSTEQVVAQILGTANSEILSGDAEGFFADGYYGAGRYDAHAGVTVDEGDIPPPTIDLVYINGDDNVSNNPDFIAQFHLFSRQLFAIEELTDADNWQLLGAGPDDDFDTPGDNIVIEIQPTPDYSIGSRWFTIDVVGEMPNGLCRLIGFADGLHDPFGNELDGDGDQTSGDDFVFPFEYTGHIEQDTISGSTSFDLSANRMTVGINFQLGPEFVPPQVFQRYSASYAMGLTRFEIEWDDAAVSSTTGSSASHAYASAGTYEVHVTATGAGSLATAEFDVVIVIDDLEH